MRARLDDITGRTFDAVVIGGGINGASAAQHIAAQGHDVLLVDKGDFGSGSSGRSSRLLHCGLRYLAPGRSVWDFVRHPGRLLTALTMARQATEARSEFVETSSVRASAMRFAFPIYRNGPYRGWQVDAAFGILKVIGPRLPLLDYRRFPAAQARALPLARELRDLDEIDSVAVYREYQFDWPERVCIDCALDAERLGASVRNYTEARIQGQGPNGHWRIGLRDTLDQTQAAVETKVVLNMTGIWIDDVNRTALPDVGRRVLGTKGAHLLVKLPDEYAGYGVATLNSDNEPFYCIPWHDLHFFGPTETVYEGDKDTIHVTREEQDWLLKEANRLLPRLGISASDIRMTWAGVRPLTYDEAIPFGNRSRQLHDLAGSGMPNVLAMTAGPVMSHRSAGRLLAKEVAARVKARRPARTPDLTPRTVPEASDAALQGSAISLAAVRQAVASEHAVSLMDVLLRRTGLAWRRGFTDDELALVATAMREERGLPAEGVGDEIDAFRREFERLYGVRQ